MNDRATDDDVHWIRWMLSVRLLPNSLDTDTTVARAVHQYREHEATLKLPRGVAGMSDHGVGFASELLVRGNPTDLGPLVPRRYVEVIAGSTDPINTQGSGRRELAELIASPQNPLAARVMVNRIWHHGFGTGIVRTTDDFWHLGEQPSHPDLLDYLADRFMKEGWSIKTLLRHIVSSETFKQSGLPNSAAKQRDPNNRLLHHYPVRRLDAEAVRDTILAVSGRLDPTLFGPGIHPYRKEPKEHRKLYAGSLDGDGRRSVYLKVTRMEGSKFLELFDLPNPMETRGSRDRTNVPAQTLALLNDPLLVDQARFWGKALVQYPAESLGGRIDDMFLKALSRLPTKEERDRMVSFVERLAELHSVPPTEVARSQEIWQDMAHVMFNLKELIYVR